MHLFLIEQQSLDDFILSTGHIICFGGGVDVSTVGIGAWILSAQKLFEGICHAMRGSQSDEVRIMRIVVATNHVGFRVKNGILAHLRELKHEAIDFGPANEETCDYPDFASKAARAVSNGEADRAILVGGTGIGMSIVANKFKRVRAALCHCELSARMSRSDNDANVLCLSANLFDELAASRMIEIWLATPFGGGRHARRVDKITQYERSAGVTGDAHHEYCRPPEPITAE